MAAAVAAAILAAIAGAVWALLPPGGKRLHVAGTAGRPIRVLGRAAVGGDCERAAMPDGEVLQVPAHGTVVFRETEALPKEDDPEAASRCRGRTLAGKIVFYNPKSDFRGRDAFAYRIGSGELVNVEVDVH